MPNETVNSQIVDGVAIDNAKCVAGQPASLANLALANAVSFQQLANNSMVSLMASVNARCVDHVLDTSIIDAVAVNKVATGNDVAQQLATLGAAIAQVQQTMKGAQTTPPSTG